MAGRYYGDNGDLFSPSLSTQQRKRITIDDQVFWLIRAPK
jgi:hypothetical protein